MPDATGRYEFTIRGCYGSANNENDGTLRGFDRLADIEGDSSSPHQSTNCQAHQEAYKGSYTPSDVRDDTSANGGDDSFSNYGDCSPVGGFDRFTNF